MLGNMVRFQHFQPRNLNIQIHLLLDLREMCIRDRLYDKRDDMAKRDAQRDIERSMRDKG